MPRIYPLFSSSKGNCTYIGSSDSGILVDCGVSFTRLKKALELNNLSIEAVKAVFVTHDHSDHVSGLKVLTKRTGIPVISQSHTLDILYDSGMINSRAEDIKNSYETENMSISCFTTSHDAAESCGYRINFNDGKSCSVCTDLGYVSDTVKDAVIGSDAIVIESNYDADMLRTGPYPAYLKERIRSKYGHLSNEDCGKFSAELIKNGTTRLILGHLSQDNNRPDIAEYAVESIIAANGYQRNKDYMLYCAPVETVGGFISF